MEWVSAIMKGLKMQWNTYFGEDDVTVSQDCQFFLNLRNILQYFDLNSMGNVLCFSGIPNRFRPTPPPGTVQIVLGDESYDDYEHAEPFDTLAAFCFKVNT